jgi:hypothetical protein
VKKKAPVVISKGKTKVRKTPTLERKSSAHHPDSSSEARFLLKGVIEDNLETFKLLARY